jgi:hypothetical protein
MRKTMVPGDTEPQVRVAPDRSEVISRPHVVKRSDEVVGQRRFAGLWRREERQTRTRHVGDHPGKPLAFDPRIAPDKHVMPSC